MSLVIFGLIVCAVFAVKIYLKVTIGMCRSFKSMEGKTVIITGANTGIGLETAKDLAARGARVILACRSFDRGTVARDKIIAASGNDNVAVRVINLGSMKSIRQFAENILKTEKRLDVLVNNAAVAGYKEKIITEDGLEYQMATNQFGPFLLTNLLLGVMKKSAPSRVVVLSSFVHHMGTVSLENLNSEKSFDKRSIYNNSKLANLLFTKELARRLEGTGVTAYSVNPGLVSTELIRNAPIIYHMVYTLAKIFMKSAVEGAQTSIYCSVSDDVSDKSGLYFSDCKEKPVSKSAQDMNFAKKLWEYCEEKVALQPKESHL